MVLQLIFDVLLRYSTIWLARALPIDGKLITLELSPHHAKVLIPIILTILSPSHQPVVQVALENLKTAGVDNQVTIILGPAVESIAQLHPEEPFDLVFIDADKESNTIYFAEAKRLLRKGGIIVRISSSFPLLSLYFLSKRSLIKLYNL